MKRLQTLVFLLLVLAPISAQAMESLRNCTAKVEQGYVLLDRANTCQTSEDCTLYTEYMCECVGKPVNKKANMGRVKIINDTCIEDALCEPCGPETDHNIVLQCEQKKCVRYIDGKRIDK